MERRLEMVKNILSLKMHIEVPCVLVCRSPEMVFSSAKRA